MKTHISGLSLLVHLMIIGFATIWNFATRQGDTKVYKSLPRNEETLAQKTANRVLSVFIILGIGSSMLFLTSVALTTALHEGADEPQIMFIKGVYSDVSEEGMEWLALGKTITYTATASE